MKRAVLLTVLVACGGAAASPPTAQAPLPAPPPQLSAPAAAMPTLATPPAVAPPLTLEERAAKLHREAIVVDTHDDITSAILEDGFDLGHPTGQTATDLPRMRAGGVTAEFFSIFVDSRFYEHPSARDGGGARRALDMIDVTYQQIERHPQDLVLATSAEGIRQAKRDGKIAVLMGIEGGYAIEDSLYALRDFYRLGVRYMTLTHATHDDWADSSGMGAAPPQAEAPRADAVRRGGRPRDAAHRDARRRVARERRDGRRRPARGHRPDHRLALERACALRRAAQPVRRSSSAPSRRTAAW